MHECIACGAQTGLHFARNRFSIDLRIISFTTDAYAERCRRMHKQHSVIDCQPKIAHGRIRMCQYVYFKFKCFFFAISVSGVQPNAEHLIYTYLNECSACEKEKVGYIYNAHILFRKFNRNLIEKN